MKRFKLFVQGVSTNWVGAVGVALTTSAFILFIFFELLQVTGLLTNAYVGLIGYMALPAVFIFGLLLMPIGWAIYRRISGRSTQELLSQRFTVNMTRARMMGSSLMATIGILTIVNIMFIGVGGVRMLHFMDSSEFCGTACHSVMEPEWVAYQNSPHANVRCVECHVGEGAKALFDAKLNGLWQVVSATFDLYERPIPTPVHQLRPASETCEKCHAPEQSYGDRLINTAKFAFDEASTPEHTTLALKVGASGEAGAIHWHTATENTVRYQSSDEKRLDMVWVEVGIGTEVRRFTNSKPKPTTADNHPPAVRTMDCIDCHNRATHIYVDPEVAVDAAFADGRLSRSLPFAKKVALAALTGNYGDDKERAAMAIETSVRRTYQEGDTQVSSHFREIDQMVTVLQKLYRDNIFPGMKVTWNSYPSHIGHRGTSGCFRCHNKDMVDEGGKAIGYDCTLCHSILAMESKKPFQYLLPQVDGDRDRDMHEFLRNEYMGRQHIEDDQSTGVTHPNPKPAD